MNPSNSLLHELHLSTLFGVHTPARCRNSINMLDQLKLELVPAAGDKLVLKLSPPPPPLAWVRCSSRAVCTHSMVALRATAATASASIAHHRRMAD